MSDVKQTGARNLEVALESGETLDVRSFSVQERLSTLFQVNLVALSENASIDFDAVVGQPARFSIATGNDDRFWSGVCNHFEQVRVEPTGLSTYEFSIVPTLWFLTQRKNYRMFQQISEPDIALKLLSEWNIEPLVRIDRASYKKRKYRVQYAESDFSFLSRTLEDAGVTFYFEQAGEETRLVLSDAPQSNPRRSSALTFIDDPSAVMSGAVEFATNVRMGQRVRPGKYTMRDHDYRKAPDYKLMSTASKGLPVEERLERFQYTPGAFLFGTDSGESTPSADDKGKVRTDEKEAALLAQKRLDAQRGSARVATFDTNAHDLSPGVVLNLAGHPHTVLGEGRTILVVESTLRGTDHGEWSHRCEARGTDVPFRPELSTPKPKVNGVESATVVGPPGEEIHTDEFGRVRVHFHWDRESKMDDNSSCWIHVSQAWGGAGYGATSLPRVGQEVLVDFLGGDPDRPVIVGRVYTNLQKVPYKLPENKTQSGLKTNSTGGGGGYNELMFDDAAGNELLNIQAQKDLKKLVKNDEIATIGNDHHVSIGNDLTKRVTNDETSTIGGNRAKIVANNEREVTGNSRSVSVGVNRSTQVGSIDSTIVGGTHVVTISPPGEGLDSGGNTSTRMENKIIVFDTGAGAQIAMIGSSIHVQAQEIKLTAKNSIILETEAGAIVTLVGDQVSIASPTQTSVSGMNGLMLISPAGDVTIGGGPMVKVNPPTLAAQFAASKLMASLASKNK